MLSFGIMLCSELWFVNRALRVSEFQKRNEALGNALHIHHTVLVARAQSSRLVMVYTKGAAENAWLMCVYNQTCPSLVWEPVNVYSYTHVCEQQVALSAPPLRTATVLSTGIRSAGRRPCNYCGRGQVLAQSSICITVLQKPVSLLIPV